MSNTFTCAICDGQFEAELTDEQAASQLADEFPGWTAEDCVLICDDCFKRGAARYPEVIGAAGSLQ